MKMIFLIWLFPVFALSSMPRFEGEIDKFNYKEIELRALIEKVSEFTGHQFVIDPAVRGKITIQNRGVVKKQKAYLQFLSALSINGFTIVPMNGFYKVRSSRNAMRDRIPVFKSNPPIEYDQMMTYVHTFKYISPHQVMKYLRVLPSKDGEMVAYGGQFIITDYGPNIGRVLEVIRQIDHPGNRNIKGAKGSSKPGSKKSS